ncbi:MAG TPA: P1 family peptidase [Alphaproteobacteria bacterium]|nr:P1 family peptidase [Alphaproteobacteria bacterium]
MSRRRLRDLGIAIGRLEPGPWNTITDVPGVQVGHFTLIEDEPRTVRSGVTAILPRAGGDVFASNLFAAIHSFNGYGEMTGIPWIEESGILDSPILITNTCSVGVCRDAIVEYAVAKGAPQRFHLPVVAETWDGWLSDIHSFSITKEHAWAAMDAARAGPVPEGNVGGGTGMIAHEFKGGIGTASRRLKLEDATYTVGALVQANYGSRRMLRCGGIPVGEWIGPEVVPVPWPEPRDQGSIIVVLATDAPLIPAQCKRLARRATTGLAWVGGYGSNSSGDIFIAFSTGNVVPPSQPNGSPAPVAVRMMPSEAMTPLFLAAAEATEEAILNAICMAETMTGWQGRTVYALPLEPLKEIVARGRAALAG